MQQTGAEQREKKVKPTGITIRLRLLIGFVLMALVPALAIAAGSTIMGFYNGRQQAHDRLESVASLKELEINAWIEKLQNDLVSVSNEEYALERMRVVLDLAQSNKYLNAYNKVTRNRLLRILEQTERYDSVFLINLSNQIILSTDPNLEGKEPDITDFIVKELDSNVQSLICSGSEMELQVAVAIRDAEGETLGVLAGNAQLENLVNILEGRTGLGQTGKSYLADINGAIFTSEGTCLAYNSSMQPVNIDEDGSETYTDYRNVTVIGVRRWIPGIQTTLVIEQDLSEALRATLSTLEVNLGIALGAVVLAIGASWVITRGIATPIADLAHTSTRIAGGDLERVAKVEREDEIGTLARAFNSMTRQLRELITNLERRVEERTRALTRQTIQLETSAQVSREITSVLDIDQLMQQVVNTIQEAFGYYHVSIFMLDQSANQLVLQASSGSLNPQRRRLDLNHNSLNGVAVLTNEAVLIQDTAQDKRFLTDDNLPDTHSELVVPMRVGKAVIATLDVQSEEPNSFTPEDVLVIQSLADQIAIAIQNARLYRQAGQAATLEERQRLARELHDSVIQSMYSLTLLLEGGRRLAKTGQLDNAEDYFVDLWEIARQALKELRLIVYELRPPELESEGLVGALQQRLDAVEGRAGIDARLLVTGDLKIPPAIEQVLYRVAQEALNNTLKHSAATEITVQFDASDGHITLQIEDNGKGFQILKVADMGGMGLLTMHERVAEIGGKLLVGSRPGTGTTIKVVIEVNND
ncbi:MAG: GAF domain-containing protein [Anaerolineales bacterium]|nr:GAF domain-containing protein [Anaerolineales bacterium]